MRNGYWPPGMAIDPFKRLDLRVVAINPFKRLDLRVMAINPFKRLDFEGRIRG